MISPYLPLTNVVEGLRASMFGSYDGNWMKYMLYMLPWAIIGFALNLIAARRFDYVEDAEYGPAVDLSFLKRKI